MTALTKPRECAVEGCIEPMLGRGWCSEHYHRWRRTGNPLPRGPLSPAMLAELRHAVGLPAGGPTTAMVKAWIKKEKRDLVAADRPEAVA